MILNIALSMPPVTWREEVHQFLTRVEQFATPSAPVALREEEKK